MTDRELRREIRSKALRYASGTGLRKDIDYYESLGKTDATVMFVRSANNGRHPNFVDASWNVIRNHSKLLARVCRPHPQRRALPAAHRATACELDSSNSSDALLMNMFCFPGALELFTVPLGVPRDVTATIGFPFKVPNEKTRDTQVDLCLGSAAICESKLCEEGFTKRPAIRIAIYRDFNDVFGRGTFHTNGVVEHYQLIRNVLAAHERKCDFILLYDERRDDLLRCFEAVAKEIRVPALRRRCRAVTWQQLAAVAPHPLRIFLSEKYGI